jgi:Uncharacterised nucleotidyltransferase
MDWEYLLRTARRHGVAPMLYWCLDAACPEAVPEDVFDRLRDHFRANNLRNLFLSGELLRILRAFQTNRIPAVPYKGPALAASTYGNLGLREFHDLDILVHRQDVPKAKQVLASMGYRPRYQLTRAQEAAFLRSQFEHPFAREDGKSVVELHWGVVESHFFLLDAERLWDHLDRIPLGGDNVLNLSPEDMLLVLCVHGTKHAWERLGWICDVAELIRVHQDIEWDRVMTQANAPGGERMLLLGLFLARDLLEAPLPEEVSRRIQTDPTLKALAGRIRERLFRETGDSAGVLMGYEAPAFHTLHLEVRERLWDKISYCVRKATTMRGEDWEMLPLPKFLFPFYFLIRPVRLARKYGLRILRRLL